jgi:hypothetical protein
VCICGSRWSSLECIVHEIINDEQFPKSASWLLLIRMFKSVHSLVDCSTKWSDLDVNVILDQYAGAVNDFLNGNFVGFPR